MTFVRPLLSKKQRQELQAEYACALGWLGYYNKTGDPGAKWIGLLVLDRYFELVDESLSELNPDHSLL